MPTILVTGAAGFIGSHTCDLLLACDHTVIGVDDFSTGKPDNLAASSRQPRFRLEKLDIAEPGALERLAVETLPDAIVHLAALVSVPQSIADPALNFRLNIEATQRVALAARAAAKLRRSKDVRVVFASSAAIYGNCPDLPLTERSEARPISPYGGAKLASEAMLFGQGPAFGMTVRCLRYFNVYGPRQDPKSPYSGVISIFHDRFRAGVAPTIFGDGEQTRDFISVRDVARANVIAATTPHLGSGVTNICTGKPTSLNRLAAILQRQIPGAPAPTHGPQREGDVRHSQGSPDRAKTELGFVAEIGVEEGLGDF